MNEAEEALSCLKRFVTVNMNCTITFSHLKGYFSETNIKKSLR